MALLFLFDFLSSSNSTLKRNVMFVAYLSLQAQRNLAARAHRYGCIHRCGPAFRVMHNYYFLVAVCVWGTKGQESCFCRGGGPHYSFLCPKPPPCVTLQVCCASSASLSSPTALPPPPPSGLPGQEVQSRQRGFSWASSTALKASGGWWHLGQIWGLGPLHSTFPLYILVQNPTGCFSSQMPSSVFRAPEVFSGLPCRSLLNTDNKMADETGDLITLVPGDMRCRQYVCNFSACMWPKHFRRQHLQNREWLLWIFFFK